LSSTVVQPFGKKNLDEREKHLLEFSITYDRILENVIIFILAYLIHMLSICQATITVFTNRARLINEVS